MVGAVYAVHDRRVHYTSDTRVHFISDTRIKRKIQEWRQAKVTRKGTSLNRYFTIGIEHFQKANSNFILLTIPNRNNLKYVQTCCNDNWLNLHFGSG